MVNRYALSLILFFTFVVYSQSQGLNTNNVIGSHGIKPCNSIGVSGIEQSDRFVPPSYDTDFQTLVLPRLNASTPDSVKSFFNTFIIMLKDSANVATLAYGNGFDALYWFGAWDSASGLFNWCGDTNKITPSVNATFTRYQGFTTAVTTGFLNTNFNPATEGISYTQNSASFGFYSRTNSAIACIDMGMPTSLYLSISAKYNDNKGYGRINSTTALVVNPISNSLGFYAMNRSGANTIQFYKNGDTLITSTPASSALVSQNFTVGLGNSAAGNRQYLCAYIGKSFTMEEHRGMFNCIEWLADKLGAGVV
jgi:hypothetical protein